MPNRPPKPINVTLVMLATAFYAAGCLAPSLAVLATDAGCGCGSECTCGCRCCEETEPANAAPPACCRTTPGGDHVDLAWVDACCGGGGGDQLVSCNDKLAVLTAAPRPPLGDPPAAPSRPAVTSLPHRPHVPDPPVPISWT